ncbi:TraK family protein [Xanthomonas translucens]|uniref:TraK family protein n=1 Tax=Xanthomonas campestris pv. translucens TaxID=343 RepID=UPI00071E70BB|nr:TraK family protein [Xanthomonas translucens]UKE41848.1 TraK family protein [Xanthomonas translucens pv. undulosa]
MAKSLSDRIAERMSARQPTGAGKNRASFLALRNDVKKALDDGWPVKVIWETLRDEGKIPFGYDAFIGYVNRLVRSPDAATPASPSTDQVKSAKPGQQEGGSKAKKRKTPEPKNSEPAGIARFDYNPKPNREDLL